MRPQGQEHGTPPAPNGSFRVALVSMPFGVESGLPSIQLALLRAIAERAGFATDTYHLNLDLARRLTPRFYDALCHHRGHMTGEWLFALAAFGPDVPDDDEAYFAKYPEEVAWLNRIDRGPADLSALRRQVLPGYLDDCLEMVDWQRYQVVGFTSSFQQNVASLALARRIKERHPGVRIVFGGANMDGEMGPEHARAFPFIDYVVVGEGDQVFPTLLRHLAAGEQPGDLPGLVMRLPNGVKSCGQAVPVRDLDDLPTPNYDEYFERARRLGLLKPAQHIASIPFESSRGCWWGQKQHCTFCGLTGSGMGFRVKTPQRLFDELAELTAKYRTMYFRAADNILDMKYVKEVFPALQKAKTDYQFFYEVKANLTQEQIRTLYLGGVRQIQPGIESLSTHVLQLMRKGCTMLQNVRLLRWARYYKIDVIWNLIWGFPGETEEDFRQELDVLKRITHLQPPLGCSRIWLERFAPYFFDRESFPVHDVRPEASYRDVYPRHVALDKVAYFFDYAMDRTTTAEAHEETVEWLKEWWRRWTSDRPDTLLYRRTPEAVFIEDRRGPEPWKTHVARGAWGHVYEFCSQTMRTVPQVIEHLDSVSGGVGLSAFEVSAGLEDYCRKGLMLGEDGLYLSLALPVNPNW